MIEQITQAEARRIQVAPEFTILEYGVLGNGVSNGTVAEVNGRYPLEGWGRNLISDEIVYVISGTGALETPESIQMLTAGDVLFVPKQQAIAWRGEALVVFVPCVPAWRPEQHELI